MLGGWIRELMSAFGLIRALGEVAARWQGQILTQSRHCPFCTFVIQQALCISYCDLTQRMIGRLLHRSRTAARDSEPDML